MNAQYQSSTPMQLEYWAMYSMPLVPQAMTLTAEMDTSEASASQPHYLPISALLVSSCTSTCTHHPRLNKATYSTKHSHTDKSTLSQIHILHHDISAHPTTLHMIRWSPSTQAHIQTRFSHTQHPIHTKPRLPNAKTLILTFTHITPYTSKHNQT